MAVGTYALTTLVKLKAFMGITGATNDGVLEYAIDRTTQLFETLTDRKLKARDYSYDSDSGDYESDNAILDGNGTSELVLPQYPINSLTTVRINTTAIDERSTVLDTGWVLEKKAGIVRLSGYIFTEGMLNIELEYNAGYTTVPEDLESICLEQSAWLFKKMAPGGNLLGVAGKSLPDGSITYMAKDLLPTVKRVLENYKKRIAI